MIKTYSSNFLNDLKIHDKVEEREINTSTVQKAVIERKKSLRTFFFQFLPCEIALNDKIKASDDETKKRCMAPAQILSKKLV